MKQLAWIAICIAMVGNAHAQSSVTMFGIVGGGVRWTGGMHGNQIGFDNNVLTGNNIGLKGTESLGGGVNAYFVLQNAFSSGTGAFSRPGVLFSQDAQVGVSGPFGYLSFGRQLNAAEDIGVTLDPYSARGSLLAMVPGVVWAANYFTLDSRFNNTMKYAGKFGGLTIRGSYSPGGVAGNFRAGSNFAAGATYRFQTLIVAAAYQETFNASASQRARTAMTGAIWQLGAACLYVSYSMLSVTAATDAAPERRDRIPAAGIIYEITPSLKFTGATYYDIGSNLGNQPGASGRKLTSYAVLEYYLSKRTELYLEMDRNGFSGAYKRDPVNVSALNLRPDGRAVTGVSIGMMTQF